VQFVDLLGEKNTVSWLINKANKFKRTGPHVLSISATNSSLDGFDCATVLSISATNIESSYLDLSIHWLHDIS